MEIDIEKCYFITKYHDCRICNGKSLRIHCRDNNNCYFKQLQRLKAENEELKREKTKYQNRYQQLSGSYNRAMSYKQCLDDIEEQIEDIVSEKCNKPCEECTGKPLCDKYYILQLIKQVKEGEE